MPYFEQINCKLLGLSVDSNASHLAWIYDIYNRTGIKIPFPIVADRNGEIARKYGMISSSVSNTETVRNVYIIDDKQVVRTVLVYPLTVGRNISEILRIVRALQAVDKNGLVAPANWVPCENMIIKPPQTISALEGRVKEMEQKQNGMSWYLSFEKPEKCEIDNGNINNNYINSYNQRERIMQKQDTFERTENVKEDRIDDKNIMQKQMARPMPRTIQWKNFR